VVTTIGGDISAAERELPIGFHLIFWILTIFRAPNRSSWSRLYGVALVAA
jgi:hypothetical protein